MAVGTSSPSSLSASGIEVEARSCTWVESLVFFLLGDSSSSLVAAGVCFSLRFLAALASSFFSPRPSKVRFLYLLSSPPAEGLRVDGAASSSLCSTSREGMLKQGPE